MAALCRFGLPRCCSSISSLSFVALRQSSSWYVPSKASSLVSMQHLIGCNQDLEDTGQFLVQRSTLFPKPVKLSTGIWDSFLLQSQLSQNFGTSADFQKYICPSRHRHLDVNIVILDNIKSITSFYDCPVSTVTDNMSAPTKEKSEVKEGPGKVAPKMEAKLIMRIRHKKMKRHKLKKLRKKMYFLWSRQKKARKARRMKVYRAELAQIEASGDNFDALHFVQEQITKAKKGGYSINMLDSKAS